MNGRTIQFYDGWWGHQYPAEAELLKSSPKLEEYILRHCGKMGLTAV